MLRRVLTRRYREVPIPDLVLTQSRHRERVLPSTGDVESGFVSVVRQGRIGARIQQQGRHPIAQRHPVLSGVVRLRGNRYVKWSPPVGGVSLIGIRACGQELPY